MFHHLNEYPFDTVLSFYFFVCFYEAALGILRLFSTSPLTQPELSIFTSFVPISFKFWDYKQSRMNSAKDLALYKRTGGIRKEKIYIFFLNVQEKS